MVFLTMETVEISKRCWMHMIFHIVAMKRHRNINPFGAGHTIAASRAAHLHSLVDLSFYLPGQLVLFFPGKWEYLQSTAMRRESSSASLCIGCGKCETHCPQGIPIRQKLKEAVDELELSAPGWLKLFTITFGSGCGTPIL